MNKKTHNHMIWSISLCELNAANCRHTLTCTKTQMILTFDNYLFGTEDETAETHFTSGLLQTTCGDHS